MTLSYKLSFFKLSSDKFILPTPIKDSFTNIKKNDKIDKIEQFTALNPDSFINAPEVFDDITIFSFTNDFFSNIPKNNYNINYNNRYVIENNGGSKTNIIRNVTQNLTKFTKFLDSLGSNNSPMLPLKIYRPNPPAGYVSLGDVFCNTVSQLTEIISDALSGKGVCCIPKNCIREIRNWNVSDKVYEYNKNNIYWALYFNPFTGTFISTNNNQLPDGKVSKVVACVKKCTAVDDLETADECARKYYNINKKINSTSQLAPDLVADQEEIFYLNKLKTQSDNITKLSTRAQQMQLALDKSNIINREMNKNKLQTYIDKQKINIDLILKKLIEDKNNIETNINIPRDARIELLKIIPKLPNLSNEDKKLILHKLIYNNDEDTNNENTQINNVCPEYDTSGLVKKSFVSNVCYGCDTVK